MRFLKNHRSVLEVGVIDFSGLLRAGLLGALSFCCALPVSAQLDITDAGTPSYKVTIDVPPGISGMSPAIGLAYNGSGVNGPVGHGWSIQGLSIIARCGQAKAIDGFERTVRYDSNDKLCLDGQRLIQTDANGVVVNGSISNPSVATPFQSGDSLGGSGTAAVREYRTEKDSFVRIRAYGSAGGVAANGPAYFKIWTKNGQIYEYGNNGNATSNSAIVPYGKTAVAAWVVSRISDTLGNYIDFQYEQRDVAWGTGPTAGTPIQGHEWNLLEIRYTGNGSQLPANKVVFSYDDRAVNTPVGRPEDRSEVFGQGAKNVSIRRLNSIRTYVNAQATAIKVKTFKLVYDNGLLTNRSRLKKVTECAGSAETQCLPPTNFSYSDGGGYAFASNAAFKASALSTTTMLATAGNYGVMVGDFNGDGRSDFIRWSNTPSENRLYLSAGNGTFTQVPVGTGAGQFNVTDLNFFRRTTQAAKPDECFMSTVGDFNGDGASDILRWAATTTTGAYPSTTCPASQVPYLLISNGDGSFTRKNILDELGATVPLGRLTHTSTSYPVCSSSPTVGCLHNGATFYIGDFNSDGLLDLLTVKFVQATSTFGQWGITACSSTDATCGSDIWLGKPNGSFSLPRRVDPGYVSMYSVPGYDRISIMDVNGDGIGDLNYGLGGWVYLGSIDADGSMSLVRTTGFPNCVGAIRHQLADINGDGRVDAICPDESVSNNAVLISTVEVVSGAGLTYFTNSASTATGKLSLKVAGQDLRSSSTVPGASFITADFNADEKADILRFADNPASNVIYISNGDGTFNQASGFSFDGGTAQLNHSDGATEFVVGDFTGKGSVEILRLRNGAASATTDAGKNLLYERVDKTPPDQLVSVTSPSGLTTTLTWAPLSNSVVGGVARYTSDRSTSPSTPNPNAAVYPKVDLNLPNYVVVTTAADSGVGTTKFTTEYSYTGLKATYDGRGPLGFRETRQQSPAPNGANLTVLTQFLQSHPYIGVANKTETYLGTLGALPATPRSSSLYTYCDRAAAAGAAAVATSSAPCPVPVTARVQWPYLYKSVETGTDLAGTALPSVTTVNNFDATGNPTSIAVTTSGTAFGATRTTTKTTSNTYTSSTSGDNWILGRLQQAAQQNSVPNIIASVTTSAGSAANASATQGTGTPPPIPPAALSAILPLLLDE